MGDFRRNSRIKNNKKIKKDFFKDDFKKIKLDKNSIPTFLLIAVSIILIIIYMIFSINKYNIRKQKLAMEEEKTKSMEDIVQNVSNVDVTDEEIKANNDTRIKIGIFGNILCPTIINTVNNNNYDNIFSNVKEDIQDKDLSMGTLNTNFVSSQKLGSYNSSKEFLEKISDIGVDVLDISNSHAFDYNEDGLQETKDNIETSNISTVGICNKNNLNGQVIKDVKGVKVGILSYMYLSKNTGISDETKNNLYVNSWNAQKAEEEINKLKKDVDYIIIDLNLSEINSKSQIDEIINKLTECNVDTIICTNSNVVKRLEMKERKDGGKTFISYGLGNLLSSNTNLSLMVGIQLIKNSETGKISILKVNYDPIYCLKDKGYKLLNIRNEIKNYESKVDINKEKSSETIENIDEKVYNILSQQLEKIEKIIGSEE